MDMKIMNFKKLFLKMLNLNKDLTNFDIKLLIMK